MLRRICVVTLAFIMLTNGFGISVSASASNFFRGPDTSTTAPLIAPAPELLVRGENTHPGEIVVLHAVNIPPGRPLDIYTNIDFSPNFFPDGQGGQMALLPVSYFKSPGEFFVEMRA